MSKYGSGMSMKTMQILEWEEIEQILAKYRVSNKDRKVIADNYKDKCFQWCKSNAVSCYMDETFKQLAGEEAYNEYTKLFIHNFALYEREKLNETFPWYGEDLEDE